MLFDPSRRPKPYPMLGSPARIAIAFFVLLAVVASLFIILPALAD